MLNVVSWGRPDRRTLFGRQPAVGARLQSSP